MKPTPAQEFISLYAAGVNRTPEAYKEAVRNNPEYHAARLIEGLSDSEIAILIKDEKDEARALTKHGY